MIKTLSTLALLPVGLYLIFIVAIHFQQVQREVLFINRINFPNPKTLKNPVLYGFPDNQVRNFYVENGQNNKLGVWQIIPTDSYWKEVNNDKKYFNDNFYDSFFTDKETTTLIYLHGNVGNRASTKRSYTYQKLASINKFNVISVDYTGFGDSTGTPTEQAIVEDSKAVWDWLIKQGASPDRLIILGHSMGTAVATKLTEQLQDQQAPPKALILKAPLSNVQNAMFDYKLLGRYSILGPIGRIPQFKSYIYKKLKLEFDSLGIINKLKLPILILHGTEDKVLPMVHGETLFEAVANSTECESIATLRQGIPQSVKVLSSECQGYFIQLAKFDYIGHSNFHRFDSVFQVIQKFCDKI